MVITNVVAQEITGLLSLEVVRLNADVGDVYRSKFSHVSAVAASIDSEGLATAIANSPNEGLITILGANGEDVSLMIFGF